MFGAWPDKDKTPALGAVGGSGMVLCIIAAGLVGWNTKLQPSPTSLQMIAYTAVTLGVFLLVLEILQTKSNASDDARSVELDDDRWSQVLGRLRNHAALYESMDFERLGEVAQSLRRLRRDLAEMLSESPAKSKVAAIVEEIQDALREFDKSMVYVAQKIDAEKGNVRGTVENTGDGSKRFPEGVRNIMHLHPVRQWDFLIALGRLRGRVYEALRIYASEKRQTDVAKFATNYGANNLG